MNIISRFLLLYLTLTISSELISAAGSRHLLYVVSPGIRNYLEYGGIGILVFDVDDGYKFVRRIPTWTVPEGKQAENVKGIAASAKTGIVYVTSLDSMIAIDAVTGKTLWSKTYPGGCDRLCAEARRDQDNRPGNVDRRCVNRSGRSQRWNDGERSGVSG